MSHMKTDLTFSRHIKVEQTNKIYRRGFIKGDVSLIACAADANTANQIRVTPQVLAEPNIATSIDAWICD